jgi:hypothetical protein
VLLLGGAGVSDFVALLLGKPEFGLAMPLCEFVVPGVP